VQVCNKGLRLMLAGDDEGALIDFREELSSYGQYFSDRENTRGATFIYVLYKLTEHVLPPEATNLEVWPGAPTLLNFACPGHSAVAGTPAHALPELTPLLDTCRRVTWRRFGGCMRCWRRAAGGSARKGRRWQRSRAWSRWGTWPDECGPVVDFPGHLLTNAEHFCSEQQHAFASTTGPHAPVAMHF